MQHELTNGPACNVTASLIASLIASPDAITVAPASGVQGEESQAAYLPN
jgi:hypothetical protein